MENLLVSTVISAVVGYISAVYVTRDRIRYEKIYTEQAESIKKLYQLISDCYINFHSYTNRMQDVKDVGREDKRKRAGESYNSFSTFFEQNRIFFGNSLCESIEKLQNMFNRVRNLMELSRDSEAHGGGYNEKIEAWDMVSQKILSLKNEVENQFRRTVGIE